MKTKHLEIRWSVSRGRDTYGYNICSLWVDGVKVASCNGGGYDMVGTVLGSYIAKNYADRLKSLKASYGSGDPNWRQDTYYTAWCSQLVSQSTSASQSGAKAAALASTGPVGKTV